MTQQITCSSCGKADLLSPEEIADARYTPLCTDCMRARSEANQLQPDDRVLTELN